MSRKHLSQVIIVALLLAGGAVNGFAQESESSVSINVPSDLVAKICPVPVWKGTTLLWRGVTDRRPEPEVGLQSKKKGKDPVHVVADPSLEKVLENVLPDLLSACGLHLVREGKIDRDISAEVRELHAGVEKGIFTGKSMAKSRITFILRDRGEIIRTVDVGYEMESKKVRQRSLKQFEETLSELIARTLGEIPRLDGLKEL